MKACLAIGLALLFTAASCANWAVLVAGSNGFYNYRHQADVFHAYQSLLKKGMDPNNIIVMAYDDIAGYSGNPFPGKIFNKPTYANPGVDVYAGVKIDYKGANVTPQVFMDVLTGNKNAVAGKGTGRVLESTSADNVFIFFSDHGATGLIAFPSQYLYANDLIATLNKMRGNFSKLVFYLETCESGSMFVNLPKNTNIYALSAAGTSESSWATYCSPDDVILNKHIGTCLGDLFSVSFIEDIDNSDITTETLDVQFTKVKKLTTLSVVMQWGDTSYVRDLVADFVSGGKSLRRSPKLGGSEPEQLLNNQRPYHIRINYLTNKYQRERTDANLQELLAEMRSMQHNDNLFYSVRHELGLDGTYDVADIRFDCLKNSMEYFEQRCGKMSEYAYQYVKLLVENCEKHGFARLLPIVDRYCPQA